MNTLESMLSNKICLMTALVACHNTEDTVLVTISMARVPKH